MAKEGEAILPIHMKNEQWTRTLHYI